MKPLIGITPSASLDDAPHGTFFRYALARTYVDAVQAAGGIPVILPESEQDVATLLERLDGLILSGGGDLDPNTFGESEIHPRTYGIDPERDQFEIAAWHYAVEQDLPTLCICRGIQVMNVAQGGTLIQHLPAPGSRDIAHRQHERGKGRDDVGHPVTLADGDHPLRHMLDRESVDVNSFHHQAVLAPGRDLEVIATAPDGVIEALWHPAMRFGLGVQWHPEMLAASFPEHAALFEALVRATDGTSFD